jgi:hypothetical protein
MICKFGTPLRGNFVGEIRVTEPPDDFGCQTSDFLLHLIQPE